MNLFIMLSILSLFLMVGCATGGKPPENAAPTPPVKSVTHFDAKTVDAGFAKGGVLVDGKDTNYQVHTSRRIEPGIVELHTRDTDIFYILQGEGTFVTGGKAIDMKEIAPGEFRGKTIEGGTDHKLRKGDVIIIPAGIPHWFKEVQGELHYYTIKVR